MVQESFPGAAVIQRWLVSPPEKWSQKGKGKATITVKKGTQKKSCQVTVETPELNKTAVEMDVEDTVFSGSEGMQS